jgi:hypothetical protein
VVEAPLRALSGWLIQSWFGFGAKIQRPKAILEIRKEKELSRAQNSSIRTV